MSCNPDSTVSSNFEFLNSTFQLKENVQQLSNKERRVLKQIGFNRLHQKRVDQAVFNLMKTISHYIIHHKSALDAKEKQTWQLSIANDQTWEIWSENNQLVKICKNLLTVILNLATQNAQGATY
ncbi:hypothetical protein BLOT_016504, partial [Blomia tropicalis]